MAVQFLDLGDGLYINLSTVMAIDFQQMREPTKNVVTPVEATVLFTDGSQRNFYNVAAMVLHNYIGHHCLEW